MPKYSHPPLHPSHASTLHIHTLGILLRGASTLSYGQLGQEAFCQHHTGNHCGRAGWGVKQTKRTKWDLSGRWNKWCGWGVAAISLHHRLTQENFGLDNRLKLCVGVCGVIQPEGKHPTAVPLISVEAAYPAPPLSAFSLLRIIKPEIFDL